MKENILVVGGAGYIGSHMVLALKRAGYVPIVLDNLSTGHREAVLDTELIVGDMANQGLLDDLFNTRPIHAVMHFASFIQVNESVRNPLKYYQNNFCSTYTLLTKLIEHNIQKFIFSSTAAVYGEPCWTPIDEQHPCLPINPYGQSKRMIEQVLIDFAHAYNFQFASLRYFNAAGADSLGRLHECHEPESHLIPLLLAAAHTNKEFLIYGDDYPTPDGTCIRDFIHVEDLCDAHLAALERLNHVSKPCIYNLGSGKGWSVKEVITTAEQVLEKSIKVQTTSRRPGDSAILVANSQLAQQQLNWMPRYNLVDMINHANLKWINVDPLDNNLKLANS